MSWMEMHGNPKSGVLVLQHHDYRQQGFDLDFRAYKAAVRLIKRPLIRGIEFGQWQEDVDTRGDIIGGQVWFADYAKRPISAWRYAWPVNTAKDGSSTATGGGAALCKTLGQMSMLPLWQKDYNDDDRFFPVDVIRPKYKSGEQLHPKFPHGWKGISLIGDDEHEQIEYYFPTDPRLVAVNREGDPEMGTNIVDMGKNHEVDPLRHSRLQTFLRVVKGAQSQFIDFHNRNTVALQMTDSGCEDTRGGFWIDRPKNAGTGDNKARIIAAWSDHDHGPMVAGAKKDKHNLGKDADKHPLHSGHLALLANWWHSEEEDAPFQYDGKFSYDRGPKPLVHTPGTHYTDVWFEFDGKMEHAHLSGIKKGRFKWRAATIIYIPDIPTGPKVPPIGEPVPTGDKKPRPATPSGSDRRTFTTAVEDFAIPAFLGRPQIVNDEKWPDLRTPRFDVVPADVIARHDKETPIVGRMEWMTAISNGQIQYTQRPRRGKGSRYRGGTAPGILILMPPEMDASDEDNGFAPQGITLSTVSFGTLKETYFATGVPSSSVGGYTSGYRFTDDGSARILFERLDSDGAATNAIRFDESGNFGIFDDRGAVNWGTQTVDRLTGDRTYTWPDNTGNVVVSITGTAIMQRGRQAFVGTTVTVTFPTVFGVAPDVQCCIEKTTGAIQAVNITTAATTTGFTATRSSAAGSATLIWVAIGS